jgi:hypothetical protein
MSEQEELIRWLVMGLRLIATANPETYRPDGHARGVLAFAEENWQEELRFLTSSATTPVPPEEAPAIEEKE